MFFMKESAEKIINRLQVLFQGTTLNFIDLSGIVVASTNASAVGNFSKEANDMIQGKRKVIVLSSSSELNPNQVSAFVPVEINNIIVAVICISDGGGLQEKAEIIRQMANILSLELYQNTRQNIESYMRALYVHEWLFPKENMDDSFVIRGLMLNIDVTKIKTILVMRLTVDDITKEKNEEFLSIQENLVNITHIVEACLDKFPFDFSCILKQYAIVFMETAKLLNATRRAEQIKANLEAAYPVSVWGGICVMNGDYTSVNVCFQNAETACNIAAYARTKTIVSYEDLSIELLIDGIPANAKEKFIAKIFAGCHKEDINEWMKILKIFFKHNGSLYKTADEMYMHKNTLQYRLNKIKEKIGFDPRNTRDALILYFAMLISPQSDTK